jgi:hypothetical protein
VAGILAGLALAAGVVQIFFLPFVFGLAGFLAVVIAIVMSPRYRGLYSAATVVIGVGFVVGTTIAVLADNALY